jgi:uncharacterized membrane protein
MFSLCRAVDTRMLVLNLVFLAFVSLLPFPSDLINFADQSPSAVIASVWLAARPHSASSLCGGTCIGIQIYCCQTYRKKLSWH